MAARMPKLSEKALLRIVEAGKAQGLTPDAVVLKFVPAAPKPPNKTLSKSRRATKVASPSEASAYLKRVEAGVKALRKNPKAQAEAEKRFFSRKPIVADEEEAGRIADEAVRKYRASQRAKKSKARR